MHLLLCGPGENGQTTNSVFLFARGKIVEKLSDEGRVQDALCVAQTRARGGQPELEAALICGSAPSHGVRLAI